MPSPSSAPPESTAETILLVEDNPGDARLIEEAFETAAVDPTIETVGDGREALEYLDKCTDDPDEPCPDLVLLDLNLPRVSGFEVLDELKDTELSAVPVIVLTSSDTEEDVIRSYDLDANAYLTKPTGPEERDAVVEALEGFWFENARLPPVPA